MPRTYKKQSYDGDRTHKHHTQQHGRYIERNRRIKRIKFNRPIAKRAVEYWGSKGESMTFVIDAAGARTSRELIKRGIPSDAIVAFTANKYDFKELSLKGKMKKLHIHSSELYPTIGKSCKTVIVIHDSNKTTRYALKEIKKLLTGHLVRIAAAINVCARDGTLNHQIFESWIEHIAQKRGYTVNVERLNTYMQCDEDGEPGAPMTPFWITLEASSRRHTAM